MSREQIFEENIKGDNVLRGTKRSRGVPFETFPSRKKSARLIRTVVGIDHKVASFQINLKKDQL
jgi:hypothetical protein